MNTHNIKMNKHFIPLVYICKCTGLTILCNKNPTFSLYFMIQFQLLNPKKGIIFQSSYRNRCQISVLIKLHLTRKVRHRYDLEKLIILLPGYLLNTFLVISYFPAKIYWQKISPLKTWKYSKVKTYDKF